MDATINWWDWLAIALGGVGVVGCVMAVHPFAQAIWGRPHLEPEFSVIHENGMQFLRCYIINTPLEHWLLSWLRVRRESGDVTVEFLIREEGTNKVVVEPVTPLLYSRQGREPASAATVPTTSVDPMVWFTIVYVDKALPSSELTDTPAMVVGDDKLEERRVPLPPGVYKCTVVLETLYQSLRMKS